MASTDELLFHISEKIDELQVQLSSSAAAARLSLQAGLTELRRTGGRLASGEVWQQAAQRWRLATAAAADRWTSLREFVSEFDVREFIETTRLLVLTEASTVHLCLLGAGFGAGLLVGYLVGRGRRVRTIRQPALMRAVICGTYEGLDGVLTVEDQPRPELVSPTEVLVRVKAATVDRVDLRIASGYGRALRRQVNRYNPHVDSELPVVLGRDLAGVVDQVGSEVTQWQVGDPVWAAVPFWRPGTLAEFVVLEEKELCRKPDAVTFERAAALPYSGTVAWNALVTQGGIGPDTAQDKRVLVHAAASGVGLVATQLLKAWGGHVTTTVSARLVPLARMLGADDVIEYDTADLEKELSLRDKFDLVLNTAGPSLHASCLRHCAETGLVVSTVEAAMPSDRFGFVLGTLYALWIRLTRLAGQVLFLPESWGTVTFSADTLAQLAALVDARELQAVVEHTFDWQDADAAFHYLARGDAVGKPVVSFRHLAPPQPVTEDGS
ncbi:reticulon-4-interacting protein 1 homolog, mitochondrial-like [Amphibalanus amphitrite]|uniref:reticulon-4-interacting protein 1 homolog, mitochondrial-like n=1 Tax=Amphibalanus amphitrite TaxID=1232801 RepID=UPI001C92B4EE|nr:reticulon-4-interacting protein 1 homolog, mitochondrial-like [Amphibalanus amphitrite]